MFIRINSKIINLDHCVKFYAWDSGDRHTVEFKMTDGSETSIATMDAKTSNKLLSEILKGIEDGDTIVTI